MGNNNSVILRIAYTLFLGLILATFIGVGIAAFYKPPKMPDDMAIPMRISDEKFATSSGQMTGPDEAYQRRWSEYNEAQKIYDRNVSAVALGFSVVYLVFGLLLFKQILILSDGLLLGSVFTLLYSIARGFNSQDEIFRFFVVSVGLVIALILGYIKFVKVDKKSR